MPNRWLILSVLFLARTAMGFQFQSVASVSPLLIDDLAMDLAMLGALIGAWMLPGVVVSIPGGALGRRFGDKRVVLLGLGLMVLGSFAMANAGTYGIAMAGRIVSGMGAVLLNVLAMKMVADWFADKELATAMGLLVMSWPLGIGLGLIILGPLASLGSWPFAMQVSGWACALALVSVALLYREPGRAAGVPASPQRSWRVGSRELGLACVAGVIWTFYNAGYIIVVSFSPVLLAEKGLDTANAAVVTSFATWPLVATVPIGGVLADRTRHGHGIMLGCLLAMAAAMPVMLAAPSPLVALALIGALAGPAAGIIMALPGRALRPESRHLGMGVFFALYYLGMALLPGVAGWLRELTGIDSAPLLFGSALLVMAAAFAMLFRHLERR